MITFIAISALYMVAQVPEQTARPTVSNAISTMFVKYANASALTADMRFTQTAQGKNVVVTSYLQYQKDKKFYLKQVRDKAQAFVISDGKFLTYPLPIDFQGRPGESIIEAQGDQTILDVFNASSRSLFDNSPFFDVLISRKKNLRSLTEQWVKLAWEDSNSDEWIATGNWRINDSVGPSGTFRLEMTTKGDPVRYTIRERVVIPKERLDIEVVSDWQIKVEFDKPGDPTLYKVKMPSASFAE